MTVETIISAEALRVADEYIDYRLGEGWTLFDIGLTLEIYQAFPEREDLRRAAAIAWQGTYARQARHADYERRMARRAA